MAATETFVRRFSPSLLELARKLLQDESRSREVVRETLVAALSPHGEPRRGESVLSWLRRQLARVAVKRLDLLAAGRESTLETLLPVFDERGHRVGPVTRVRLLAGGENRLRVRACIDRMPQPHRTIFILCDIEGMGSSQVASVMGMTVGAVRMEHHRARKALLALLDREASRVAPS